MAGLIISDAVIKTFVGDVGILRLPFSITIECVKNISTKRKHIDLEDGK